MSQEVTEERFMKRRVCYNPELAKLIGLNEAIMVHQLYYWSDKTKRTDGWFYKEKEELHAETGLTRFQQDQAKGRLKQRGLIDYKVARANGSPTLHFMVHWSNVEELLQEAYHQQHE